MRAFLFCHPERSGERKREPRSRMGLARKRTCYKFFCRVRNCSLFLARSLRLVAFTGLPKSIEELFGKRSGRRSGQGGKRSEPSAMAPWRDEVGMTKRSKASFHPSKIYHSTFYIYHSRMRSFVALRLRMTGWRSGSPLPSASPTPSPQGEGKFSRARRVRRALPFPL